MNRRLFIRMAGLSSLGFFVAPAIAVGSSPSSDHQEIETAVQAAFGGGFVLNQYTFTDGSHKAIIEHLENRYEVESDDGLRWRIVTSSV